MNTRIVDAKVSYVNTLIALAVILNCVHTRFALADSNNVYSRAVRAIIQTYSNARIALAFAINQIKVC